jgi:hypothetical protein
LDSLWTMSQSPGIPVRWVDLLVSHRSSCCRAPPEFAEEYCTLYPKCAFPVTPAPSFGYSTADCGNNLCEYGESCRRNTTCSASTGYCSADCTFGRLACPTGVNATGSTAVCSGSGACLPASGTCACFKGYTGPACQGCTANFVRLSGVGYVLFCHYSYFAPTHSQWFHVCSRPLHHDWRSN